MSGRSRLPGGEQRKASQKRSRVAALPVRIEVPWRAGDKIRWRDRAGVFRRDVEDAEHAEIVLAERV